jgi:hypothetical protein
MYRMPGASAYRGGVVSVPNATAPTETTKRILIKFHLRSGRESAIFALSAT